MTLIQWTIMICAGFRQYNMISIQYRHIMFMYSYKEGLGSFPSLIYYIMTLSLVSLVDVKLDTH